LWAGLIYWETEQPSSHVLYSENYVRIRRTHLQVLRGQQSTEDTGVRHVPVGTDFQPDGAPPHLSRRVPVFLDRYIPDCWMEKGRDIFPGLTVLQI